MHESLKFFCIIFLVTFLPACSIFYGEMDTARKAIELAVDCQTDEALKAVEQAESSGGIAAIMADFEREAILRESGRTAEAEAVKAARDARTDIDEKTKDDAEKTVLDIVDNIRKERKKKTGSARCN